MRMKNRWRLGPISSCLDIDQGVGHELCQFFEMDGVPGTDLGAFTIAATDSETLTLDEQSNEADQVYHLSHGLKYVFDGRNLVYKVNMQAIASGIVDLCAQTASWRLAGSLPPRSAFHMLILDPLSLFAPGKNIMICHGAVVTYEDIGILLFGKSQSGKSTLAFLLSHKDDTNGFQALTDDTLILDFTGERVSVWPVPSGFGLSPYFLDSFGVGRNGTDVLQVTKGKYYVRSLPNQAKNPPYIVGQAVFLEEDRNQRISHTSRLSEREFLFKALDSQTSIPTQFTVKKLELWSRLAQQVKSTTVSYSGHCDPLTVFDTVVDMSR